MTLNLWDVPKDNYVVIISFKEDERTHVVPRDNILKIQDNLLKGLISFKGKSGTLNYEETNYTYEEFEVIAKLYNNYAINYKECENGKEILDYYGFDWRNLLIKNLESDMLLQEQRKNIALASSEDAIEELYICDSVGRYR